MWHIKGGTVFYLLTREVSRISKLFSKEKISAEISYRNAFSESTPAEARMLQVLNVKQLEYERKEMKH